jgi:tetratricopeptide (TPR) repeat protein
LEVASQEELVWLRCLLCRRVSFNPIWNVQRDIQFAIQDGTPFEYEQYFVRQIPPGLVPPFAQQEENNLVAAEARLREEIDLLRRTGESRDQRFPEILDTLAELLLGSGRFADALALSQEALAARPPGHPRGARSLNNLASAFARAGDQRTAETIAREALALQHATLGKGDPHTLTTLANLAESLRAQGRYADAEPMFQEVVELAARHPEKADQAGGLIGLLVELLALHDRLGDRAAADADVRRLLDQLRDKFAGDERAVATALGRLAESYSEIEPGAAALLRAHTPQTAR